MWKTDVTNDMSFTNTILIVLLILWQIVDVYTTNMGLLSGATEQNPLVSWCVNTFGLLYGLIGLKIAVMTYIIVLARKHIHLASLTISLSLLVFIYGYAMMVCNIPKVLELNAPDILNKYVLTFPSLELIMVIVFLFTYSIIFASSLIGVYINVNRYGPSYFFRPPQPARIPEGWIKKSIKRWRNKN